MRQKAQEKLSAAEAIAKPFPVAAVVFPTESRISVRSLTSAGSSLISAIPPALSAIGPKASIANCIAVVAIIAEAAKRNAVESGESVRSPNSERK